MNTKNLIYILSLLILGISFFLVVEYSNSNRISLIVGMITAVGFCLNIAGFLMKNKNSPLK